MAGPTHRPNLGIDIDALRLGDRPRDHQPGVAELLDQRRLQTLYRIGVDEICYRHPHRYLTIIGDHDTGTVTDIQPGRSEESLTNFYDAQPDSTLQQIQTVSMDVSRAYTGATTAALPHATICYDPFHIMQWVNRDLNDLPLPRRTTPQAPHNNLRSRTQCRSADCL
jgi:transposase